MLARTSGAQHWARASASCTSLFSGTAATLARSSGSRAGGSPRRKRLNPGRVYCWGSSSASGVRESLSRRFCFERASFLQTRTSASSSSGVTSASEPRVPSASAGTSIQVEMGSDVADSDRVTGNASSLSPAATGSVRELVADLVAQSLAATFPELAPAAPGLGGGVGVVSETEFPKEFVPLVAACNNAKFGDYQCNNAMGIWSRIKGTPAAAPYKNPNGIGQALRANLPESPMVSSTSLAGPGFLNLTLSDHWLAQRVRDVAAAGSLRHWAPRLGVGRALVDFSSPNIAKEMHVGHLRSTIIGDCIARMLEFCGVEVLRRNHVGDWGTQFGMLIEFLFQQFPDWQNVGEQSIGDLQTFYKAAKKKFDEDAEFKDRAQKAVVKLQGGDPIYRQAWATICDVSRKEFDAVYKRLGVKLEEKGESFYNPIIPQVLEKLRSVGLVSESEGAQCIWVEGFKVPLIVVKSDGGFNYATTDLACIWYRIHEEKAEWVVYVTDVGQSQHFDMFFKAARMAGWLPMEPEKEVEEGKKGDKDKGGEKEKGKKGKNSSEGAQKKNNSQGAQKNNSQAQANGASGGEPPAPVKDSDSTVLTDAAQKETEDTATQSGTAGAAESEKQESKAAVAAAATMAAARLALSNLSSPPPAVRVNHVGFGLVLGEDGKRFRTRSSEVVRLVDLLDEAKARAKKGMEERERNVEWSEAEIEAAAEAMGYGAVKYADLKNNRITDYKFDFDQMLDMKGNTAVYLLYAHARICSIIRKSGQDPQKLAQDPEVQMQLVHPSERALVLHLCRFPEVLEDAIEALLPNTLCEYLYNLSGDFTNFYTNCPVIDSPEMKSRLILCEATALVMRQCLQLLGITALYRL